MPPSEAPAGSAPAAPSPATLSIGGLARRTGLSSATLRVWERRYGYPRPLRLPSGHRRYRESDVAPLRRIAEGLARGLRPGALLGASEAERETLLAAVAPQAPDGARRARWLGLVTGFDREGLEELYDEERAGRGAVPFLQGFLGPFLTEVGRAWADGELEVRHEHFAYEVVEGRLRAERAERAEACAEPYVASAVLATLPGEEHTLGLHMSALVCEEARIDCRLLENTPLGEIAGAAAETGCDFVAVGVSLAAAGPETDARLAELRDLLPDGVPLVVGGAGACRGRRGPRGVRAFDGLEGFARWLRERAAALASERAGGAA